jgi:hypothetical protein
MACDGLPIPFTDFSDQLQEATLAAPVVFFIANWGV